MKLAAVPAGLILLIVTLAVLKPASELGDGFRHTAARFCADRPIITDRLVPDRRSCQRTLAALDATPQHVLAIRADDEDLARALVVAGMFDVCVRSTSRCRETSASVNRAAASMPWTAALRLLEHRTPDEVGEYFIRLETMGRHVYPLTRGGQVIRDTAGCAEALTQLARSRTPRALVQRVPRLAGACIASQRSRP